MICFPNIKINIGLNILSRRKDGYHNIESVFFPVPYCDILEILPSSNFEIINKGIKIDCPIEKNLCFKAHNLIKERYEISPIKIILFKNVPFGTGLGAGSSDAAHTLILLNRIFDLKISEEELIEIASSIGADCAFFIKNKPVLATGIGNIFQEIDLQLTNKHIVLCLPNISINTAFAYKNCKIQTPEKHLPELIKYPISEWKNNIKNDFETSVFREFPNLKEIKQSLYDEGAIYAQMSGSGSAIFGIFENYPKDLKIKNSEIRFFTIS
ncbi:4-(cytidine 5'-diphospho)-2-C-methyl-D-erythritol kinase [Bacteroidales bacterium OttesenSCG-928-I21]|nr:4-(cytidine 5'-diphospho)-2-C-methyl-D-erythritol kinase [Bacteroidales bacterium OttesenSCG-928-I21]